MCESKPELPLGVTILESLERVSVRQKVTVLSGNKYAVVSPSGEMVLEAREAGGVSLLVGKSRPFDIEVHDEEGNKVMQLRRPFTFGPDKMQVSMGPRLVSVDRQEMTLLKPVLLINDPNDRLVLRVKGPTVTTGVCDFEIFTPDKKRVGVIKKLWSGFQRELLTESDSFQIVFPAGISVDYKAAIIGTCFLIDFLYYES